MRWPQSVTSGKAQASMLLGPLYFMTLLFTAVGYQHLGTVDAE